MLLSSVCKRLLLYKYMGEQFATLLLAYFMFYTNNKIRRTSGTENHRQIYAHPLGGGEAATHPTAAVGLAVEQLFGKGHQLTKKRDLSQPGEFLAEERVKVVTGKGEFANVAVLLLQMADFYHIDWRGSTHAAPMPW